jgi:hypothetical protein
MSDNQGLTVGLAVGIPSFVILSVVSLFWYRNHRKQRLEDLLQDDIDIGLRDDQSFQQFHQELAKPVNPVTNSNGSHGSNGSSTLTDNVAPYSYSQPGKPSHGHKKSISDFYETFIPVLPEDSEASQRVEDTFNESGVDSSLTSMFLTTPNVQNDRSLDNLAKHLSTPQFFEKLPSRPSPISVRYRASNTISNNSSSDILNNLVGEDVALNDNFIYDTSNVEMDERHFQPHTPPKNFAPISMAQDSSPGFHSQPIYSSKNGTHGSSPLKPNDFDSLSSSANLVSSNMENEIPRHQHL